MNVLLIGSGGRENALAYALAKSPLLSRLYAAPGNPGIARFAEIVALDVTDHAAVIAFCGEYKIGFVVVGPEAPLVAGLVDDLAHAGIKAFGPRKIPAQLEGSKGFTKDLCREANIPTAAYERFSDEAAALAYVSAKGAPIVVKADGLAAGKGVTVAMTLDEAIEAIKDCFGGAHGAAGAEVVIEEFLTGDEASFFVMTDGTNALPFGTAQDHKRVGIGDTGPNTGGMGAYSPAPIMTPDITARAMNEIVLPTIAALKARGTPYTGVLYAGLILTEDGPKLIEYNARFGDPETQVLMMRLTSDILAAMIATSDGTLDQITATWRDEAAMTVVLANKGYPGAVVKGSVIKGIEAAEALEGVAVFHAGTGLADGQLIATGGRVLNVTALGSDLAQARSRAYAAIDQIEWSEGFCRNDIGWRALKA
jgi:phosphoribosylamine--glycine ligase